MATGWAKEGAVQEQIDATVNYALHRKGVVAVTTAETQLRMVVIGAVNWRSGSS